MFFYVCAGLFLLLFVVGLLRDRRSLSNAVLLGLGTVFLAMGLIQEVERAPDRVAEILMVLILLLPALGTVVLAALLLWNGVTMVRKEGRSLGNLLSLLAGLGIVGVIGLTVAAVWAGHHYVTALSVTALLIVGYVAFLFLSFVGYAFLYQRLTPRQEADFVVVLGSGLISGDRVPPLLASRLERGRQLVEQIRERGGDPLLITSGGQGPDELLPESHAMADYLTARGFPVDRVLREDRSRTTEQNLLYSQLLMREHANGTDYRCLVVTNNFHAFRAATLARWLGIPAEVVGSPTAAYYWPSATIREFAAIFLTHKWINFGICALLTLPALASLS